MKRIADHLKRHGRFVAFVILVVVTVYGVGHLDPGDWQGGVNAWRDREGVLALALALALLNIFLDWVYWMWTCRYFRLRVNDVGGVLIFLSALAGLFLPMKLGNLIRPDAIARLKRGPLGDAIRMEIVALYLDAVATAAILTALACSRVYPWASPIAGAVVVILMLLFANHISSLLSGTQLALPKAFWWRWQTFGIILVCGASSMCYAMVMYVLIRDLVPGWRVAQTLFAVPASALAASGTGLPGGVGAIEAFLGASLRIMDVEKQHLLFVVGIFRVVTFWIWLPMGWVALILVNRKASRIAPGPDPVKGGLDPGRPGR